MTKKDKKKINGRYHLNCRNCGSLFWSPDAWKIYCPRCSYVPIEKIVDKNVELFHNLLDKHTELSIYCQHCMFRHEDYCSVIKGEADPSHPYCAIKTQTINY